MPDYRRHRIPGGTYFFTVTLADRRSALLVEQIDLLRQCVRRVRHLMPFHIDAWVVLPEHMHTIWTLPPDDDAFAKRWHAIKTAFSKGIPPGEPTSPSRRNKGERGIWQRRYWEHHICDERDYAAHMDYIHFNPVKHGLAQNVADWPYSSFRHCVARGLYPSSWAGNQSPTADYGEPSP